MMMHKKIKHREKIDFCQNYNAGGCPFEDKKCWFLNIRNNESFKCNICEQTFIQNLNLKLNKMELELILHKLLQVRSFQYLEDLLIKLLLE